jgi:hypothetical protein
MDDRESGWLINRNWIIATPMEAGIAPRKKACRALHTLHGPAFVGPWGVILNAFDPSRVMTVSTGVMAVAQARYGYADRALELLQRMCSTFGMASPGTISEMSPDYGCFVQAWTAYAMFVPVIYYFFGVQPMAADGVLRLAPAMPAAWREASLDNVRVLDGAVSLRYARTELGFAYRVAFTGKARIEFVARGRFAQIDGTMYPIDVAPLAIDVAARDFTVEVTE